MIIERENKMFLECTEGYEECVQDLVEHVIRHWKNHASSGKQSRKLLRELECNWIINEVECSVDVMICSVIEFGLNSHEVTRSE